MDGNNRLTYDSTANGTVETVNSYFYDKNGNQLSKKQDNYTLTSDDISAIGIMMVEFNGADSDNPPNLNGMYNSYLKIVGGSKGKLGIMLVGVVDTDSKFVYEFNQFDSFNRLVSVLNEKGLAAYKYKADGLRLSKTVNNATSSNVTTTHIWDGSNIVLELNANGGIIDTYIRGVNLIKSKTGGNSFYIFNAHGDVTGRANSSGSVTKRYHYDAFGVEKNKVDNDKNPFRYCGKYLDLETNTYYLRARNYTPATSHRMLSEDSYRGGPANSLSLNLYTYCYNNPYNVC